MSKDSRIHKTLGIPRFTHTGTCSRQPTWEDLAGQDNVATLDLVKRTLNEAIEHGVRFNKSELAEVINQFASVSKYEKKCANCSTVPRR